MDDAQKHPVDDPDAQWARISSELVAYRDRRRQAWGDLDDLTLARYLAGEATEAEAERVHRAMDEHPKVRECVAIVREVAGEMVTTDAEPVGAAIATIPLLDSARRYFPKRRFLIAGLGVAASLFLASTITFVAITHRADQDHEAAMQYAKATPVVLTASGGVRRSPSHEAIEEVLKKYGLKQKGSTIVLAAEPGVQEKVTEVIELGKTKAVHDLHQLIDATMKSYAELAKNAEVQKALDTLGRTTNPDLKLGPSPEFLASVKLLDRIDNSAEARAHLKKYGLKQEGSTIVLAAEPEVQEKVTEVIELGKTKAIHDLHQLIDATMKSYAELAKNAEVQKALDTLGRTTNPDLKLGPSPEFLAGVKLLDRIDNSAEARTSEQNSEASVKLLHRIG